MTKYKIFAAVLCGALLAAALSWTPAGDSTPRQEFYGSPMATERS